MRVEQHAHLLAPGVELAGRKRFEERLGDPGAAAQCAEASARLGSGDRDEAHHRRLALGNDDFFAGPRPLHQPGEVGLRGVDGMSFLRHSAILANAG